MVTRAGNASHLSLLPPVLGRQPSSRRLFIKASFLFSTVEDHKINSWIALDGNLFHRGGINTGGPPPPPKPHLISPSSSSHIRNSTEPTARPILEIESYLTGAFFAQVTSRFATGRRVKPHGTCSRTMRNSQFRGLRY